MRHVLQIAGALVLILGLGRAARGDGPSVEDAARAIRRLDGRVLVDLPVGPPDRDVRTRLRGAAERENAAWERLHGRDDWEGFRDERLAALRRSLGRPAPDLAHAAIRETRRFEGDGYRVTNLVFESRPGLVITANLYGPSRPAGPMPGFLIVHSHHAPKSQGELQDMGVTWARSGCLVLIMDQIGHGERRQHPFRAEDDFPRPFRVGRQDYYFRFNTGLQLQLVGESLMGWMVHDLGRGADVLLAQPGIDPDRLILLGAVAGGGDPAAVAAALDPRFAAVVPFNFGGPQPDYAIPADPARDFYFFGVASWESTRSLRLGARDGFAQWLIAGAVAPRRLVYAHEFAWNEASDPVWPRIRKVYAWYGAEDRLAVATGRGTLRGQPPESSHCTNIGPLHRRPIHEALNRWFGLPIPEEVSERRPTEDLDALTERALGEFDPRPVHEIADDLADVRLAEVRARLAGLDLEARRQATREAWAARLGHIEPPGPAAVISRTESRSPIAVVERIVLEVGPGLTLPALLLLPPGPSEGRHPVVIGLAQAGKAGFLEHRAEAVADMLARGIAVCLPDLRGTGETAPPGDTRRHASPSTARSASAWLLGETSLGARLRDARSLVRWLRQRPDLDPGRVALWGDSFAPTNPADLDEAVPLEVDPFPTLAEPAGGILAMLVALYEDGLRTVAVRGTLVGYRSLLESPFVYVPHDSLIPDILSAGDVDDLAGSFAPGQLRRSGSVDGRNRLAAPGEPADPGGRAIASWVARRLGL